MLNFVFNVLNFDEETCKNNRHHLWNDSPEISWTVSALLPGSSTRYQGGLSPPWGPGPVNMKLLIFWRRPHLLHFPGQVVYSSTCYNIKLVGLSTGPDPWALSWLLTRPKAELMHMKGNSCPLPSWPVLPKGPVSIHCSTPVPHAVCTGLQALELLISQRRCSSCPPHVGL